MRTHDVGHNNMRYNLTYAHTSAILMSAVRCVGTLKKLSTTIYYYYYYYYECVYFYNTKYVILMDKTSFQFECDKYNI